MEQVVNGAVPDSGTSERQNSILDREDTTYDLGDEWGFRHLHRIAAQDHVDIYHRGKLYPTTRRR